MYETISVYFYFLLAYPLVLAYSALQAPLEFFIWLIIGATVVYLLMKFNFKNTKKIFISVWFMPGTIICGAASIVPWPTTLYGLVDDSGCSNLVSITITLMINLALVFGCVKFYHWYMLKRKET